MPTKPPTKSSAWRGMRVSRMNPSYPDVFGTYVPASIGKFAGILGYTDLLHEALQEAIDKNQPIEDWDSLGDSLHEASRERRRARK